MTYLLTVWLLWPKATSGQPSEIVRHVVDSLDSCRTLANYFIATVAGDGVFLIAMSCVQLWGV